MERQTEVIDIEEDDDEQEEEELDQEEIRFYGGISDPLAPGRVSTPSLAGESLEAQGI